MPSPPAYSATVPRCAAERANSFGVAPWVLRSYSSSRRIFSPNLSSSLYSRQSSIELGLLSQSRQRPLLLRRYRESSKKFPVLLCQPRQFSSTTAAMAAEKIDGTQIAKDIRAGLKDEIEKIQQINPRFKPSLVIFQGTSQTMLSAERH